MQFKKIIIAITITGLLNPLNAQTVSRWHRLPRQGQPQTIKNPLERSAQPGELLRFNFETRPVTPLLRVIKRSFSELYPVALPEKEGVDISRATVFIEELNNEANKALSRGYDDLDLSKESEYSIFDPEMTTEKKATDSSLLPENLEIPQATISLKLGENN